MPSRDAGVVVVAPATGLVSPAWVAERLDDPRLVLVEVDEEAATYHWSHLPGATFVDWQDCRRALLAPRPASTEAFEHLMSLRGIRPDDDVVLYGDGGNRYACAVLWLMRHHGHRSLRIMDGGRAAWEAQDLPMAESETLRAPSAYRTGAADLSIRATRDDVLQHLAEPAPDAVLLDCRTPQEFAGQAAGPDSEVADLFAERGHLPAAVNLPATDLLAANGSFLPAEQLAQVLAGLSVHAGQSITAYCHTSDRSCLVWFAAHEVLGYPSVRVYDGGWLEYSHLLGVPVTGPEHADLEPEGRPDTTAAQRRS